MEPVATFDPAAFQNVDPFAGQATQLAPSRGGTGYESGGGASFTHPMASPPPAPAAGFVDPFGYDPSPAPLPSFGATGAQDDARSEAESVWTIALSEVTMGPDGVAAPLNMMESILLLKAGDKSKFTKHSPTMDLVLSGALLLELLMLKKISVDAEFSNQPNKLKLNLIDDSPTPSKLVNSTLKSLAKRKGDLTLPKVIQGIANSTSGRESLTMKMLWRLVQKKKLSYDPRLFGADKYPVIDGAPDLQILREKVVGIMDGTSGMREVRDEMLSFLYYLPKDASGKIFSGQTGAEVSQIFTLCRSIAWCVNDLKQNRSWM